MKYFRPDSVIYHGGCYDGFTSAWLLWKFFPDAEFLPATYGKPLPEPLGKNVLMVGFSYPRSRLETLAENCNNFLVLDHHKTAREALDGLDYAVFDMERAGCQMVQEWLLEGGFKGNRSLCDDTWLIDHVADRDLWRLDLPDTPFVHAYYSSVPMTFQAWSELAAMDKEDVVKLGKAIRQAIDRYCEKVGAEAIDSWTPWGNVLVVNAPYLNASELASWLLDTGPYCWSVAWFQRSDGRFQYSLRGRRGFDVAEVAKAHGGGGHAGAAGFDSAVPPWELWSK